MLRVCSCLVAFAFFAQGGSPVRERIYPRAIRAGGQIVPMYDKGYLLYLHGSNRLEVFRPDGELAFDVQLPCPATGGCSNAGAAVDSRGNVAISLGYSNSAGRAAGLRFLDPQGRQTRFLETTPYLPNRLCFDRNDELWAIGREFERSDNSYLVRKYSRDGRELGRYLPASLWPGEKAQPGRMGQGYWMIYASSDHIGAVVHENHADNPAEWIEWDLNGNLKSRTLIPRMLSLGRAFTKEGRFYGLFRIGKAGDWELRLLDTATGKWTPVADNLPPNEKSDRAMLLGADGDDLVYEIGYGSVRLLLVRPGAGN